MEENIYSYPIYQQQQQDDFLQSPVYNNNIMTTDDTWQLSSLNNHSNSNQYHTTYNNQLEYQSSSSSSNISPTYLIDPNRFLFTNNQSSDGYFIQSMDDITDSYQYSHPMYTEANIDTSSSSTWNFETTKIPDHNNSNIRVQHSCEVPLINITKSDRKDCMVQTKTTSQPVLIQVNNLLEQLNHDLTYNQLSTSSAYENLLHLLDLPSIISINSDYYSLYMNAIHIWRQQFSQYSSELFTNILYNNRFAVILFLFYSIMFIKENESITNINLHKLINILQQEINDTTGIDYRLACRIKALFMKCYITLAQYYSNSNYNS
ncbi:unnamed protein product [Adineta steineri]|uniref:Uncharacterized protein n=2 Tax=Adineta steineri TaxID=433720 RepID=A0A813XLQ5_9BILA|nr:unnamed protein product [Adineta steineri]CAF3955471.1 unnamed protein product [Adineta steineri]